MRLVTWNCCSGPLARKLSDLETLEADIAVVPECPRIEELPGVSLWWGSRAARAGKPTRPARSSNRTRPSKGLAVFAAPPWRVHRAPAPPGLPRYALPVQVSGPESFLLLAVWAMPHPTIPYVRGMHRAVRACRSLMRAQPTVLLGDFNSNAIWDAEHPADRSHSALVRYLGELGLVSAYHSRYREAQGKESRPTFFLYRHRRRPYHIDYCFLPASWLGRLRDVSVGEHRAWAARSDHMPLSVEVGPMVSARHHI
ncbi:MAG TPA: endonuclease/exonuclease/phosphatase family protein [Verrucomicrobiae bacterium]|nr:endonuclease/exonuclease/phosphatase family protein [Verrucomicrobiae bacterium]